ncbi:hypothetical protein SLEP1_g42652 [Rubroshorea leprosula]|nr:hypothetical protein SLEP1_g42652 [Rubroshorea leprosula]
MVFENAVQFKAAIAKYSIKKGCKLHWKKNEPGRQRIACDVKNGCSWEIFASFDNSDDTFKVKTYKGKHSCFKSNKNKMATESFLVDALRTLVTNSPHMNSRQLAEHVKAELKVEVSKYKCQRAKRFIKNELVGCYIEQYKLLRRYGEHMLVTNPGSTCVIGTDTDGSTLYQFKRMYMCFDGCKRGWKAGCRRIIGVDGCFLKGVCKGILLTTVGRDGNNQMFPLAWAIVDIENRENWEWFMDLLRIDIECGDGVGLTIISDMHKGIIAARESVFPNARHRFCARHIYANWAKIYKGEEYKKRFWAIARATWQAEFEYQVQELKKLSEQAWLDLARIPPMYWCKAFFYEDTCCDVVDNDMCESFNFWIMEARYKAIISLVDTMREQLMERIAEKMSSSHKWKGDIAPRVKTKLGKNKNESFECRLLWDGTFGFELNGIPCPHAICCMFHENLDPEDFVVDWYRKGKYLQSYNFPIKAMCGDKSWQKFHGDPVNPPAMTTRPERLKKNRRKAKDEPKKLSNSKMSRRGRIMTCFYYKQEGHNKSGCSFVTNNETPAAIASSSQTRKKRPSAAYHRKKSIGREQKRRNDVGSAVVTLNISQSSMVNSINSTPITDVAALNLPLPTPTTQSSQIKNKGKAKVTTVGKQKGKKKEKGFGIFRNDVTGEIILDLGKPTEWRIREDTSATAIVPRVSHEAVSTNAMQFQQQLQVQPNLETQETFLLFLLQEMT